MAAQLSSVSDMWIKDREEDPSSTWLEIIEAFLVEVVVQVLSILQVYFYSFEHRSNSSKHLPMWAGVYHSAEIGYVFGWPLLDLSSRNTVEVQFSRKIIDFWTSFSKTG